MKLCFKSFVSGAIVATLGVASVFAASSIKSVEYNSNNVVFDGKAIDMTAQPMVSLVKEGETAVSNYMPLRSVLEAMGYDVQWDGATSTVHINTRTTSAPPVATSPVTSGTNITQSNISSLTGVTWMNLAKDSEQALEFSANGDIKWLTLGKNWATYSMGKYSFKDGKLLATFDFLYAEGKAQQFKGDEVTEIYMDLVLDGDKLKWTDENTTSDFIKVDIPLYLGKYDATDINKKIVGYWTCTEDEDTVVKYHFAEDGTFASYAKLKINGKDETAIEKGKYTTVGNLIELHYDGDLIANTELYTIVMASDGKSWTTFNDPSHTMVVDTGNTDWEK